MAPECTGPQAEILTAGFWPRDAPALAGPGSGFASGGVHDTCAPGAPLAGQADTATRDGHLADRDDDELIGLLRAWRRLESWCTAGLLQVIAELARRRPADRTPAAPPGSCPGGPPAPVSTWRWTWPSVCPVPQAPCTRASSTIPRPA